MPDQTQCIAVEIKPFLSGTGQTGTDTHLTQKGECNDNSHLELIVRTPNNVSGGQ